MTVNKERELSEDLQRKMDDSVEETTANILKCDFCFPDEYFETISSDAKQLLGKLLCLRGEDRVNAEICLGSPWLKVKKKRLILDDSFYSLK